MFRCRFCCGCVCVSERKIDFSNCLSLSLLGVFAIAVAGGICGGNGGDDDDDDDTFYRSVLKASIDISASTKTHFN